MIDELSKSYSRMSLESSEFSVIGFRRFSNSRTIFVWVDCEMTGLDLKKDHILEIACILTTADLNRIAQFGPLVIHHDADMLKSMNTWCTQTHQASGLSSQVLKSETTMKEAENLFVKFLKSHITNPKSAYLAGNTIHVDKYFLQKDMPKVLDCFHYRLIDVTSIQLVCEGWYPSIMQQSPRKKSSHRALGDILESIDELKWYKRHVFKQR